MRQTLRGCVFSTVLLVLALVGVPRAQDASRTAPPNTQDPPPEFKFHHVHINSVDPDHEIAMYVKYFHDMRKVTLGGFEGVEGPVHDERGHTVADRMYFLYTKVAKAPPQCRIDEVYPSRDPNGPPVGCTNQTSIWHLGIDHTEQLATFYRMLRESPEILWARPPATWQDHEVPGPNGISFLWSPAGYLNEIVPGKTNGFYHVHTQGTHPICNAQWWVKHFGGKPTWSFKDMTEQAAAAKDCRLPIEPLSARIFVLAPQIRVQHNGQFRMAFSPIQRPGKLRPTLGTNVDYIAFSVVDVPGALARFKRMSVKVLQDLHNFGNTNYKAFMIEAPDQLAVQVVDRALIAPK